ncbi:MAG: hypothetical protein WCR02_00430 [Sphaerochaetaceae bacterium]
MAKIIWAYLGEDLNMISEKSKQMLVNLKRTGKFTDDEIIGFNKSLVARQYEENMLNNAVDLHEADPTKSIKEWYDFLQTNKYDPTILKSALALHQKNKKRSIFKTYKEIEKFESTSC